MKGVRKMPKLSIGQMAKMNQVSVQTLRLYDKMGLLQPAYINQETGYRYYDMKQNATLDMIQYMKGAGMTLKEISDVFEHKDYSLLNTTLQNHLNDIEEQIEALHLKRKAIQRMISSYDRYLKSPPDGVLTLEYIEERKIYSYMTSINFYEKGIEAYENILLQLKQEMKKHGVSEYYYYNAGTTIFVDDFLAKRTVSQEIFVFVDKDCKSQFLQTLPANLYVCLYCDDFDKEKDYIPKIYQYLQEHELKMIGDYICEVVTELPMNHGKKRGMYLRLQVPVTFVKK